MASKYNSTAPGGSDQSSDCNYKVINEGILSQRLNETLNYFRKRNEEQEKKFSDGLNLVIDHVNKLQRILGVSNTHEYDNPVQFETPKTYNEYGNSEQIGTHSTHKSGNPEQMTQESLENNHNLSQNKRFRVELNALKIQYNLKSYNPQMHAWEVWSSQWINDLTSQGIPYTTHEYKNDAKLALFSCLSYSALVQAHRLEPSRPENSDMPWEQWFKAVGEIFSPPQMRAIATRKYRERIQGNNESLSRFMNEKYQLYL